MSVRSKCTWAPRSTAARSVWLERLTARLAVQPNRVFPSEALLNHIPDILRRMSEYLISGGDQIHTLAVHEEFSRLARLRRDQGYDIDEILAEFDILGEILYDALAEEARSHGHRLGTEQAIAVAERLHQALMAVTSITAATFREEGFKDRRERARLLGSFGRSLAHELRNRLGAGETALHLLAMAEAPEASRERALRTLRTTLQRLEGLSEDILALAIAQGSEESAQGRRLSLQALIEQAVVELETLALEKDVRLEVAEPVPDVQVDATRVELALVNLIGNAIKYSDEAQEPRWVRVAVGRDGDDWRVDVADNGLGIPREMQERVFEHFVRAHPEIGEGTGLGLAIAREAVEQMGGRIWLDSAPGKGTVVHFTVLDPPQARV
jgi:signal transduction histidine kinase